MLVKRKKMLYYQIMLKKLEVGLFAANCYIFSHDEQEIIIIDPGGDTEEIIRQLGRDIAKLRYIIFTHGHLDHIAGSSRLLDFCAKKEIPRPQVAIGQDDAIYIGKNGIKKQSEILKFPGSEMLFRQIAGELPEADFFLEEGRQIGKSGLQVISCPGHSKGGVCLYQPEDGLLFSGDSLFASSIGRTDFPGGNHQQLVHNIKKKLFSLPDQTRILPGHGPGSLIEREKAENPFLQD